MHVATARSRMGTVLRLFAFLFAICVATTTGPAMADPGFDDWVRGFWPEARAKGVSEATFRRAFDGVTPDPDVLERAGAQPEFVRPLWEYLESAVSDKRIDNGREMLRQHASTLDAIESRYGVSRFVVVSIWGMESSYGEVLENRNIVKPVIRSLATLAYRGGSRANFGKQQLLAALEILENGDVTPDRMYGSWAGAMGHTQFIPTTYQAHAVDFDGNGKRDIWTSISDALASTANYLRVSGWRTGETWGYEVKLPRGFDFSHADDTTRRSLSEWSRLGVERANGLHFPRPNDEAYLLRPAGANGAAFLYCRTSGRSCATTTPTPTRSRWGISPTGWVGGSRSSARGRPTTDR